MSLRYLWRWLKAEFGWRVLGKRYKVIMSEDAKRQFEDLPEEAQAKIRKHMERLSRNPYTYDRMAFDDLPEEVQAKIMKVLDEEAAEG